MTGTWLFQRALRRTLSARYGCSTASSNIHVHNHQVLFPRLFLSTIVTNTNSLGAGEGASKEDAGENGSEITRKKRLDVAIVGLPNAGKSQLLNMLTHASVSAVSKKRHTTREGVLGARTIINEENKTEGTQLVYIDTPGFLRFTDAQPERLQRELVVTAQDAMRQVDFTLVVVDAARTLRKDDYRDTLITLMLHALHANGREEWTDGGIPVDKNLIGLAKDTSKFGIVLNKVDLVRPKDELLKTAEELYRMAGASIRLFHAEQSPRVLEGEGPDQRISNSRVQEEMENYDLKQLEKELPMCFYTNARKGEGVEDITNFLSSLATPSNDWPVESDRPSNQTLEKQIEEMIREKIYRRTNKEIPYAVEQKNRILRGGRDPKTGRPTILIHQDLLVKTKSHANLVRGAGNRTLEAIRTTAVRDLEKSLKCKVNMALEVKMVKSKNN